MRAEEVGFGVVADSTCKMWVSLCVAKLAGKGRGAQRYGQG